MTLSSLTHLSIQPKEPPRLADSPNFWMPSQSSNHAEAVDWLYNLLVGISAVSTVAIVAAMVYLVVKYRAKSRAANEKVPETPDHNTTLELTWSLLPLVILAAVFVWGFKGYMDLRTPPKDAIEIHVVGQKWQWTFEYPNGLVHDELHVPVNTSVRTVLSSTDVLHSFFIPDFRVKMDAVPGRYTDLWFKATRTGEFPIKCAEYCGTSHSDMLAKVVVHKPGGYEAWLEKQEEQMLAMPPVELGEQLYTQRGCSACHSVDGTPKIGPSWKGIFGIQRKLASGGTAKVDENYLRESIVDPQAKLVAGYPPSMPTYQGQLNDREINGLIEYIKSLE